MKVETEDRAIEAGYRRLSAREMQTLMEGSTSEGLYRGGYRFIVFVDLDGTLEGKNHLGSHNTGVCSFDASTDTLTVAWANGWDGTTTKAYQGDGVVHFFDHDTGLWRNSFHTFNRGRQALDVE